MIGDGNIMVTKRNFESRFSLFHCVFRRSLDLAQLVEHTTVTVM
jgi:hypothetical protein